MGLDPIQFEFPLRGEGDVLDGRSFQCGVHDSSHEWLHFSGVGDALTRFVLYLLNGVLANLPAPSKAISSLWGLFPKVENGIIVLFANAPCAFFYGIF